MMIANAQLANATYTQVKDEAEKAAQRRRAGQGKRAMQSAMCMSRLKNKQIVDMRAFDNDGMLVDVQKASDAQCIKTLPTSTLEVLKANAEAEVRMVKEVAQPEDAGPLAMLDAERARDRVRVQEKRDMMAVEVQRKVLERIRTKNDEVYNNCVRGAGGGGDIIFNFDSQNLSADQRWEGVHAPAERAREMTMVPEDPGTADNPRPRVTGIEPFFKYGYLPPLHKLYLQRVSAFYTKHMLKHVLVPLVNQQDETALRQLDWLVTNYCKEHNLCVVGLDGKQRHVQTWYVALREALRKRHFEPFGKKWRVALRSGGKVHRTTAGQAVFLMEAYTAGVLQYAKRHCAEIDLHLRRQHRRRDKRKMKCQGSYKRAPLTKSCPITTTIVKESEHAIEDMEIGEDDEFLEWMDENAVKKSRTRM